MSEEKGFRRWHGRKREPLKGSLDIDFPYKVYPVAKVLEVIYQSTKWESYPNPYVKKLINGTVKNAPITGGQRLSPNPSGVQRYHHTFSSMFPPTFFSPEKEDSQSKKANEFQGSSKSFYCLGTCESLWLKYPNNVKKSCEWPQNMLPLILASSKTDSDLLLLYIPSKQQFGMIKGGAFYISKRGLVW